MLLCFAMIYSSSMLMLIDFLFTFFGAWYVSTARKNHAQKLINYFDRINYDFAKWNWKMIYLPALTWDVHCTVYAQVMMDSFRHSFGFIFVILLSLQCLRVASCDQYRQKIMSNVYFSTATQHCKSFSFTTFFMVYVLLFYERKI